MSALSIPIRRPQLGTTPAFALVASIIGLALFASATPSPLYGIYQQEWHFSTPVLTLVYAVYCFGVLTALLLIGRISDEVGRRPVLTLSLIGLFGAGVLFAVASSVGMLFAARALQGLMTGAALGAAGAALLDLHPRGDGQHAGLISGVVSTAGIGSGALVASVLAHYAPDPLVTPFLVLLFLIALTLVGTLALPEPVTRSAGARLRPEWPRVPASIRGPFAFSSLAPGLVVIGGLYLALGPGLATHPPNTTNHLAGGAAVLALAGRWSGPAPVAQALPPSFREAPRRAGNSIGLGGVLALGMALTAASLSTGSAVLFFGATAITGAGFGLAFLGRAAGR